MSTITTSPTDPRLAETALAICGRREGKTAACRSCTRKAVGALALVDGPELGTALLPELARIVCGSEDRSCASCWDRATALLLELRP
ncbi:hypothetical protein [Streptomyces sp. NPDC058758]|uniref:hypothetical protein n=1 Tax=Streptomyces sp. NPDC058758 TaxID=3346627 RepID=UPI0036B240E7